MSRAIHSAAHHIVRGARRALPAQRGETPRPGTLFDASIVRSVDSVETQRPVRSHSGNNLPRGVAMTLNVQTERLLFGR
jgi:hypothetical protein